MMHKLAFPRLAALALVASILPACATAPAAAVASPAERQAAEQVVDAFHRALREGNREAALALLEDDVLILEGGGAERSKAEYAEHHLESDSAFSREVPAQMTRRTAGVTGDLAWVASEGRTTGAFRGRPIDRVTAETMVLRRGPQGWRIVHIHWSSANPR